MKIEHTTGYGMALLISDDYGNSINVEYGDLIKELIPFELKNDFVNPDDTLGHLMRNFPDWQPDIIDEYKWKMREEIEGDIMHDVSNNLSDNVSEFVANLDLENLSCHQLEYAIKEYIDTNSYI